MRDRVEILGAQVWESLRDLVRELLARKPGGHLIDASIDALDLRLKLALRESAVDPERFSRELSRTIDRLLDDAIHAAAVFRPGHAYCHRCESAACRHSRPPSCRHVFVSYSPTGTPHWVDLAQYCLDLKHPQVDRLYEQPPAFLTLVHGKSELHGGMLRAFRDGSYELLGQVTAGFFRVPARAEEGRGVVAITIQAAASGAAGRRRRLGLNILGRAPSGEDLDTLWERQHELPWRRSVQWAQSALQSLASAARNGRRGRLPPAAMDERVGGILRGLARRLERDQRARSRRTRHAEARHESGRRPTRKAIDDARTAGPESCLVDRRSATRVVLGDRGRTHFFTRDGQLVTSVRYSKEAIARKIKLELWREITAGELAELRRKLPPA